jgi:hypothetical protein
MREVFLPFRRIRPLVFHRGISTRSGVPCAPHRLFAFLPSFSLCALQPPFTAAVTSSSAAAARLFDDHGGKESDPSCGCMGSFLGDGEEARGVGP